MTSRQKDPQEEEAIERFIAYLGKTRGAGFAVTSRDVPVATGENFDYRVEGSGGQKLAVEIFRLTDGEELAIYATWGRVVGALKRELETRAITGYLISSTTLRFSVTRPQLSAFVSGLADQIVAAIKGHPDEAELRLEKFILRKVDSVSGVLIGGVGEARSVDPAGTAARALQDKLTKKSSQLSLTDHERVILIVNHVGFVDRDDVIQTMTRLNSDDFPNVDLIVLEATPGVHAVVFDRALDEAISKGYIPADDAARALLVQQLKHRLNNKEFAAFEFVRCASLRHGGIEWLDDSYAREELVRTGEALVEADRVDDAMSIVRALRDDPDPDLGLSYHQRLQEGDDADLIVSVRGKLCGLISRIICTNRLELYPELINIVRQYLYGENLYIRVRACAPLQALMQRRRLERLSDGTPFDWNRGERESVKALALDVMRANAGISRVVEALMSVFSAPRDLSEDEAEEMIRIGLATNADYVLDDSAFYLICYALFRHRQSPTFGQFDSARLAALLREQLVAGAPATRGALLWHIGKIIEQDALGYGDLDEFVDLAFEPPYDPRTEHADAQIISELAKRANAEAQRLAARQVARMERYVASPGHEPIWITWTDDVLPIYADAPDELLALAAGLERLWVRGAFIGDEQTVVQASRVIRDFRRRNDVERSFREMYCRMRAIAPGLPELPRQ